MKKLAASHLESIWTSIFDWYIAERALVTSGEKKQSAYFPHQRVSSIYNKNTTTINQSLPSDPLTLEDAQLWKRVRTMVPCNSKNCMPVHVQVCT